MSRAAASAGILSDRIRRIVIEQSKRANVGHIGSSLSVADILGTLYAGVLQGGGPADPERDRFVLSKGHASLALYAALHETGVIDADELASFCVDGSRLGTHPDHVLPGVDFSTGSLGHGLSLATGSALAARLSGSPRRTFVLLSDAECNEGSVWEAVMFAAHHRLGNLVAIVDVNGQQALGYTRDVHRPLAARRALARIRLGRARRRRARPRRLRSVIDGLADGRGQAARPARADRLRPRRLVHGARDPLALPADGRRASTRSALAELGARRGPPRGRGVRKAFVDGARGARGHAIRACSC